MGLFFGTDGVRGIVNEDLTHEIAYKCGNALSVLKEKPVVVIGRDTRVTGEYLTLAVALGAMSGGAKVIDIGLCPTAGIAYLTKKLGADYGVVISASHNPKEYNGIKIFDKNGYKLGDKEEERVERCFIRNKINEYDGVGSYEQRPNAVRLYEDFLTGVKGVSLAGLSVVLDGANGAASRIAPEVFRKLGASVVATNCRADGLLINDNCGALHPETLVSRMKRYNADVGFAFDGDSDRLIAVTADGRIVDGDAIIYILACYLKKHGELKGDTAVGTSHTNMAIEHALAGKGISFIRTDIGDKYVLQKLIEKDLSVGGEQSGHIILKNYHTTGDGILTAIFLASVLAEEKTTLEALADVTPYPQVNLNIVVEDKLKIINSEELSEEVALLKNKLGHGGRIMVRASGTEPKIRIMVESKNEETNREYAELLEKIVRKADGER